MGNLPGVLPGAPRACPGLGLCSRPRTPLSPLPPPLSPSPPSRCPGGMDGVGWGGMGWKGRTGHRGTGVHLPQLPASTGTPSPLTGTFAHVRSPPETCPRRGGVPAVEVSPPGWLAWATGAEHGARRQQSPVRTARGVATVSPVPRRGPSSPWHPLGCAGASGVWGHIWGHMGRGVWGPVGMEAWGPPSQRGRGREGGECPPPSVARSPV